MSRHYNRQATLKRRALERLQGLLYWAPRAKFSHEEYLSKLREVYETPEWKGLTQGHRAWISGWLAANEEAMKREHMEQRWTLEGKSIDKIPNGFDRTVYEEGGPSGLYWKGTDGAKPWYAYRGEEKVA